MSRFTKPETVTIHLNGGGTDTITIRKRLSAGEARSRVERWTKTDDDGKLVTVPTRGALATVTAYLIDWTLTDDNGQRVDIRGLSPADLESVIDSLDPDAFVEIKQAIERHEGAMYDERETQKKTDGPNA